MNRKMIAETRECRELESVQQIEECLGCFMDSLDDFHVDFFDFGGNMNRLPVLKARVAESIRCLKDGDPFTNTLHQLLTREDLDMAQQLDDMDRLIRKRRETVAPAPAPEALIMEHVSTGSEEDVFGAPGFPDDSAAASAENQQLLADVSLAYLLTRMTQQRIQGNDTFHPQNFRHLLSYFSERENQFLLVFDSLISIILGRDLFALQERGRASRTLINNFRVEELFIHISTDREISVEDKAFVFSWLMAFQKLYRKILEALYNKKAVKERVAQTWFPDEPDLKRIPEPGMEQECRLPAFIRRFIDHVLKGEQAAYEDIGRRLVFAVNNEDILRMMCGVIHEDCDISGNPEWKHRIYRAIYDIIADHRRICAEQTSAHPQLKTTFAEISRERRIAETIISPPHRKEDRTPILGRRVPYPLLEETREHLAESNLKHLFEVWPIPEISQRLFNDLCQVRHLIPQDTGHMIQHFLYREKLLEFLMQLDRIGIRIVETPSLPLVTNAYQLHSLGMISEGAYFGSTGHWKNPTQKPPSILCCTNPNAIGNCRGHLLRHVVMRVFLGTGEFYESPFVLDSTLRYGPLDEEGGVAALFMRPGLFMIEIPERVRNHWSQAQRQQMKGRLGGIVMEKIRRESVA